MVSFAFWQFYFHRQTPVPLDWRGGGGSPECVSMLRRHKKPLPMLNIDFSFSEYPTLNLMVTLTDHPDLRFNRASV